MSKLLRGRRGFRLGLDAEQRGVVGVVLAVEVVNIGGSDQRPANLEAIRAICSFALSWSWPVLLDFQVDLLGPKT
ncbi:MAG: hypothetical protein H6532_03430 [Thermoleophilales bacterium]|nr:hypothetical protein [Thermoleophilales bacterium]